MKLSPVRLGLAVLSMASTSSSQNATTPPANTNDYIRLVEVGTNVLSSDGRGRLEVNEGGVWGTVCDDFFGAVDGRVACRQLGYTGYFAHSQYLHSGAQSSTWTGPIHMDDVACAGSELSLANCRHSNSHNCGHYEDVVLTCSTEGAASTVCTGYYDFRRQPDGCSCSKSAYGASSDNAYCSSDCCVEHTCSASDECEPFNGTWVVLLLVCCCCGCGIGIFLLLNQSQSNIRVVPVAHPCPPASVAAPLEAPAAPHEPPMANAPVVFPRSRDLEQAPPPSYHEVAGTPAADTPSPNTSAPAASVVSAPASTVTTVAVSSPGAPPSGVSKAHVIDTNGDGVADAIVIDTTGNGVPDRLVHTAAPLAGGATPAVAQVLDVNGDGRADAVLVDTTGDGVPNQLVHIAGK